MRLNKYIALCGATSRRGADALISDGKVTVNGSVADKMGLDIDEEKDVVCVEGKRIYPQTDNVYIMLNKPVGCICSCRDERGRKTVIELINGVDKRIFPVGRLDYDIVKVAILYC